MLTVVFTICLGNACERVALPVPKDQMTLLYCQMKGGAETAMKWAAEHGYEIRSQIRCLDGLQT